MEKRGVVLLLLFYLVLPAVQAAVYVLHVAGQSLDGSIADRPGRPLSLSGDQSMILTHGLRAAFCLAEPLVDTQLPGHVPRDPRETLRPLPRVCVRANHNAPRRR